MLNQNRQSPKTLEISDKVQKPSTPEILSTIEDPDPLNPRSHPLPKGV